MAALAILAPVERGAQNYRRLDPDDGIAFWMNPTLTFPSPRIIIVASFGSTRRKVQEGVELASDRVSELAQLFLNSVSPGEQNRSVGEDLKGDHHRRRRVRRLRQF